VSDNLAEKMDKCPTVELGVLRHPLKYIYIAHGSSNRNMPARDDKFQKNIKSLDLRV